MSVSFSAKSMAAVIALITVVGVAASAQARPNDDRWSRNDRRYYDNYRHDNGRWSAPYYKDKHRPRGVVVYERPYPVYTAPVYAEPAYYAPAPAYNQRRVVCTQSYNPVPTIVGGVGGGLIGNQFGKGKGRTAATVGGALIGAMLGGQYGGNVQNCAEEVFTTAAPNVPVTWYGPDSQNYTVTPVRNYQEAGRYCREYQAVSTIGGQRQQTYGTACMQPDGSWEIVN